MKITGKNAIDVFALKLASCVHSLQLIAQVLSLLLPTENCLCLPSKKKHKSLATLIPILHITVTNTGSISDLKNVYLLFTHFVSVLRRRTP